MRVFLLRLLVFGFVVSLSFACQVDSSPAFGTTKQVQSIFPELDSSADAFDRELMAKLEERASFPTLTLGHECFGGCGGGESPDWWDKEAPRALDSYHRFAGGVLPPKLGDIGAASRLRSSHGQIPDNLRQAVSTYVNTQVVSPASSSEVDQVFAHVVGRSHPLALVYEVPDGSTLVQSVTDACVVIETEQVIRARRQFPLPRYDSVEGRIVRTIDRGTLPRNLLLILVPPSSMAVVVAAVSNARSDIWGSPVVTAWTTAEYGLLNGEKSVEALIPSTLGGDIGAVPEQIGWPEYESKLVSQTDFRLDPEKWVLLKRKLRLFVLAVDKVGSGTRLITVVALPPTNAL